MKVTIVKSNATVPTIPGDAIPAPDTYYLYSVYQNQAFSLDLTFTLEDDTDPMSPLPISITSVTSSLSDYITVNFSTIDANPNAYKIRVSGTITNALSGEYYYILNENYEVVQFPASSVPAIDYLGIVEWTLPSSFQTLISNKYDFTLTYSAGSELVEMNQYVYWGYDPAIVQFKQVVAGGLL